MAAVDFAAGGYRYIPAVFQYSGGVAASPGFAIRRVRFHTPVPVAAGFAEIAGVIKAAGRPLTSFCACELRSPAPFSDDGFRAFNQSYVVTLRDWGIMQDERNPVARSNVCPEIDPPGEPSFHAFSFTVESKDANAELRRRRQRRGAGGRRQLRRAHDTPRRDQRRMPCGKRRVSCSTRWSAASHSLAHPGP